MTYPNTVHGRFMDDYFAAAARVRARGIKDTESNILRDMRRHEERSGTCICGNLIANHFTSTNRKLTCEQVGRAAEMPKETL
jgi:hypothetical protein